MSDTGVNDQPVSNESEERLPGSLPGARLAALRQERGWTVEQVASQLNLAPRQILAIERDDYPALPGMAIVRGFIRAYAKLLKVDPAPLLADLGGEAVLTHDLAPQKSLSTPFAESRMPSMMERPGLSSKWVVSSLLAALLVVGVWAFRQEDRQVAVPSVPASAANEGVASVAGAEVDKSASVEAKSEQTLPPQAPAESNAAAPSISDAVPTAPAPNAGPAAPLVSPVTAASDIQAQVSGGKDTLQFKVRGDSWIEIRRSGDNSVVLSRVVKAGETENIQVTEPISVVVGNAAGVDATLRGSPVELITSSKSNVARLNLK